MNYGLQRIPFRDISTKTITIISMIEVAVTARKRDSSQHFESLCGIRDDIINASVAKGIYLL